MAASSVWNGTTLVRRTAWVRRAVPPLAASASALAAVVLVAAALRYKPWDPAIWSRWDSGLYEDIARHGYTLFPCRDGTQHWCGNAAWFPGYPWVFGGLHRLGLPLRWTAVGLSWTFAVAAVALLWATFLQRRRDAAALAALVYAALAPGAIYLYSIFPLSMLAFATIACLWALNLQRYVLAGCAGAVAALAYPIGVLLAPTVAVWILTRRRDELRTRLRNVLEALTPIVAALGLFLVVQRAETGRWNAFFLIQDKYAAQRASSDPFVTFWDVSRAGIRHFSHGLNVVVALQTLFVTVVLLLLLVQAWTHRRSAPRGDALLLLWSLPAWVLPFSQSISVQRGQAALLPMAALVARLPVRLAWAVALASTAIALWMESYFLDWTLR
jgi:hypothetical protein